MEEEASEPLQPLNGAHVLVVADKPAFSQPVDVRFADLTYSLPNSKGKWKEILVGVAGELRAARLTAILGPSGAGKTTLLGLLVGRGRRRGDRLSGELTLNGNSSPELMRELNVCYVPQDFALMPLLTASETVYLAAQLKLPRKQRSSARSITDDVMAKLGLSDCKCTRTSELSGGEKKRLAIAVEMITNPSLLLLDEPTSGLDSASSNQVVNLLRDMARAGCAVVISVHQPSSRMCESFDDMLVLSRGRCWYYGPRDRLLPHLNAAGFVCPPFYNVAEFVIEVVTGQRGDDYEKLLDTDSIAEGSECRRTSKSSNKDSSRIKFASSKRYAATSWEQLKILLYRALIIISRDNTLTKLRISAHAVVAVLLGLVFYDFGQDARHVQSNIACVFFFPLFLFFANAMPAVQMFPTEATVFLRENTNNWYSLESYYITKVLSDLPLQILCPTMFVGIAYYMTGQPLEMARFSQVWIICTLFTILAQSFGIVTGAAFDTGAGMFLVPALNIPMFLFAGFLIRLGEVPVYLQFLSFISYFRYAFEGVLQAVYLNRPKIACSADFCYLRNWQRILGEIDMPSVSFLTSVFAISIWIVIIHILIYGVLRWKLYMYRR